MGPQDQGPLRQLAGKAICRKCHPRCKRCTGYGFHEQVCQECANYKRGEQCEDECPQDHYADETTQECVPCDSECKGCYGPEASHCYTCRNFKVYLVRQSIIFFLLIINFFFPFFKVSRENLDNYFSLQTGVIRIHEQPFKPPAIEAV